MELETVIGYLVALAVPLWLLVEQVISWGASPKRTGRQLHLGRGLDTRASKAPMRLAHPRRTA